MRIPYSQSARFVLESARGHAMASVLVDSMQCVAGAACAAASSAVSLSAVCRDMLAAHAVFIVDSLLPDGAGQPLPAAESAAAPALPGLVVCWALAGASLQSAVGALCADVRRYSEAGAHAQPPAALCALWAGHAAFCGPGSSLPHGVD